MSVVAEVGFVSFCSARSAVQPLAGAEAAVGRARLEQELDVLAVDRGALALAVGPVGTADVGPLVPGESEPAQGLEDHPPRLGGRARSVGVLDAQDELARRCWRAKA